MMLNNAVLLLSLQGATRAPQPPPPSTSLLPFFPAAAEGGRRAKLARRTADGGPSSFLHEGILWLRCIGVPWRIAWRRSWRTRAAARWDPGGAAGAGGGGSGVSRPRSVLLRVVGLGRRPAVLSGGGRSRWLSSFTDLIGGGRRRWRDAGSEHGGGVVPFRDDGRVVGPCGGAGGGGSWDPAPGDVAGRGGPCTRDEVSSNRYE